MSEVIDTEYKLFGLANSFMKATEVNGVDKENGDVIARFSLIDTNELSAKLFAICILAKQLGVKTFLSESRFSKHTLTSEDIVAFPRCFQIKLPKGKMLQLNLEFGFTDSQLEYQIPNSGMKYLGLSNVDGLINITEFITEEMIEENIKRYEQINQLIDQEIEDL